MICDRPAIDHAVAIISGVCTLAGPADFVADSRLHLRRLGVTGAVRKHDTATLFDWLISVMSFQGIADHVAEQYIDDHGTVTFGDIAAALAADVACPELGGFDAFIDCGFRKGAGTCSRPDDLASCPLPRHPLRNGRLNQTAYSLFLFLRDVAGGDFIGWVDRQIGRAARGRGDAADLAACRQRLVDPLTRVYGVSDKVATMAMSTLLLGAGGRKGRWAAVGASMIVVDTLVHNFLHRTGVLGRLEASHAYGAACYAPGGCADIIRLISAYIDATAFNPTFPTDFPRFVQLAIWRYCADRELAVCNGNRIVDRSPCANRTCQLHARCDHVALHNDAITQQLR